MADASNNQQIRFSNNQPNQDNQTFNASDTAQPMVAWGLPPDWLDYAGLAIDAIERAHIELTMPEGEQKDNARLMNNLYTAIDVVFAAFPGAGGGGPALRVAMATSHDAAVSAWRAVPDNLKTKIIQQVARGMNWSINKTSQVINVMFSKGIENSGNSPELPENQQQITEDLLEEHPGLNRDVATDAARGGEAAMGKGGAGADVRLINGGGREVSVHRGKFDVNTMRSHLEEEARQAGTTEIYFQINTTGATREGLLGMMQELRRSSLSLEGKSIKFFGPDGKVWWQGVFRGLQSSITEQTPESSLPQPRNSAAVYSQLANTLRVTGATATPAVIVAGHAIRATDDTKQARDLITASPEAQQLAADPDAQARYVDDTVRDGISLALNSQVRFMQLDPTQIAQTPASELEPSTSYVDTFADALTFYFEQNSDSLSQPNLEGGVLFALETTAESHPTATPEQLQELSDFTLENLQPQLDQVAAVSQPDQLTV